MRRLAAQVLLLCVLPGAAAAATVVDRALPERRIDRLYLDVGGFVQPRFGFVASDPDAGWTGQRGFTVRRARFEVGGGIDVTLPKGPLPLAINHALSVEFTPEARLQDAWIEAGLGDAVRLRVGQQKTPSNRTLLASDRNTMFPERGHVDSLAPRRDIGAQLHGALFPRRRIEYAIGVFNGEGTNRVANENDKFLYVGRVVFSPLGTPGPRSEVLSPTNGWMNAAGDTHAFTFSAGYSVHFNQEGPKGTEEGLLGHVVELAAHYRWLNVQSEFLYQLTDFEDRSLVDHDSYAFYAQLALFPPMVPWVQEHIAVLARFEEFDEFVQRKHSPDDALIPLAGPTDPGQKQRLVAFYAGKPLFLGLGDLRVHAVYTSRSEAEGQPYKNDGFELALHLAI